MGNADRKGKPRNVPPDRRCNAAPRPGGERTEPCKNPKVIGQERCRFHGGQNATTERKRKEIQERERFDREAKALLGKLKAHSLDDPLSALKQVAGEAVAWQARMKELVEELYHIRYSNDRGEHVRAEVALYERAMDRTAQILSAIARLNIDERLAAVTERQAEMMEQGLLAAFEEAGLMITDQDLKLRITRAFTGRLTLVS